LHEKEREGGREGGCVRERGRVKDKEREFGLTFYNALQYTAAHCNTL